jgi:hypothetical protein
MLINLESSSTSQTTHNFVVNFNSFELDPESNYEIGLIQASIWYSWYNISSSFTNNQLRYSPNNGANFYNVVFDDGIYSVSAINQKLQSVMKANGHYSVVSGIDTFNITITPNYTSGKVNVEVSNNYQLDFTTSTLRDLLGFTSIVVSSTQEGTYLADITRGVNQIQVHSSLAEGSYSNSEASDILYAFVPNSSPSTLIKIQPTFPVYLPINTRNNIQNIRMRITDQQQRTVDLNGEQVSYLIELRKIK